MRRDEFAKWVEDKTNFKKEGKTRLYYRYDEDYVDYIEIANDEEVIYGWIEIEESKKYRFKFNDFVKAYELKNYNENRLIVYK